LKTTTRSRRIAGAPTTRVEWLPLGSLLVDPELQRDLDERRAQRMADCLDLDALGLIHVSARANGTYHVTDGQHRKAALLLAGFDTSDLVQCLVAYELTTEQEARRFVGLNTFAAPRAFDKFKVRIKARDEIALGVDRVLMAHGWRLAGGATPGAFTAVVSAERVYSGYGTADKERGPQNLHDALGVLTEAWGREPRSAHGALVQGLGLFFARYNGEVDKAALVRRLAQFAGGPDAYIGKARGIREFRGGVLARCVAELTVEIYNKRRSTGQLPEWRS
jgi:hypothetical protein